ncbi:MAG: GyrI-like domain-containing protein [Methanomassiliicoccales archaeon]|nr:GyrI-like domain-containing protein [Methanomassiliicoccales archaeon]
MDWTLMMIVPDFVGQAEVERSAQAVRAKKGDVPQLNKVELIRRTDGASVHMLHVGPYDQEMVSVALLWQFMCSKGLESNGPHHEIYISDPNRIAQEKSKTVIRYPVRTKRV